MRRPATLLVVLLVVLTLLVPTAVGFRTSDAGYFEGWEDYTSGVAVNDSTNDWYSDESGVEDADTGFANISSDRAEEGSNSLLLVAEDVDTDTNDPTILVYADDGEGNKVNFNASENNTLTTYINATSGSSVLWDICLYSLDLNDNMCFGYNSAGSTGYRIYGTYVNDQSVGSLDDITADTWHEITMIIDHSNDTLELQVDGTTKRTTSFASEPASELVLRFRLTAIGASRSYYYDNTTFNEVPPESIDLSIDAPTYMEHDSTREYTVLVDGVTDVSDAANVTSSNETVLSVNNTTHTLNSTSDTSINEEVTLTVTYKENTITHQVAVGNKTLDNIAILPPPTWPSAIFGSPGGTTGATSNWPGAVQLQWIFVSLVIGALASWKLANPWLGLGTVEIMLLFGWAIDWIGDGLLIASIVFVVYAALSLTDIASGNLGPQTR